MALADEKDSILYRSCATERNRESINLPYNGKITVGRAEDNDIRVLYPFMSRHHFWILLEEGTVYVEDLQSTNGLYLNGKRVSKAIVRSGDVLSVLDFRLILENGILSFKNTENAVVIADHIGKMDKPEKKIVVDKNAWRIAYADELQKKSEAYRHFAFQVKPDGAFGIYLDMEMIHVRVWMNGTSIPLLSIPAYCILDDLGDVLTGKRAVVHAKMNQEKKLHSVLAFMQEADRLVHSAMEPCAIRYCIALMKELKRELEKTAFASVKKCVVAVSVPEIVTQKNVKTAMEMSGFHVLRIMSVVEACALAKAYRMNKEQEFLVRVIANQERQNMKAEYGDDLLEGVEYTFGENIPEITPGMKCYFFSDDRSRKAPGREMAGYEKLSEVAADGAVVQGVKLTKGSDILMLGIFPWKAGIEVDIIKGGVECIPLTWLSKEQTTIPMKTDSLNLLLDSGIEGKRLSLYLEVDGFRRKVRTWKMEEICPEFPKDTRQMKIWIEINTERTDFTLILQAGEKRAVADLNQYQEEKRKRFPITTEVVPEQALRKVLYGGKEFYRGVENLEEANTNFALRKGIQMIARQTKEVFADGFFEDGDIRVGTFIEKLLAVKDNVEYGIVGAERTTKRTEYVKEKLLLINFRKVLDQTLDSLNVMPVEANGAIFDPYIHEAIQMKETDLLEEDRVVSEVQKGYFLGEKLYRPTKVVVSKKRY